MQVGWICGPGTAAVSTKARQQELGVRQPRKARHIIPTRVREASSCVVDILLAECRYEQKRYAAQRGASLG